MSKRKATKPNLIVAQGEGWHVEFDRETKDYAAFIDTDDVGCIGYRSRPQDAQALIQKYRDFVNERAAA